MKTKYEIHNYSPSKCPGFLENNIFDTHVLQNEMQLLHVHTPPFISYLVIRT